MKKVYISADIEGTTGIQCWDETNLNTQVGTYFREQMTREVEAACQGVFEAMEEVEITINDAHDTARNLIPSKLPEGTKLIRGWAGDPECMMSQIDRTFDAVIFTGYHSAASKPYNPLSHTLDTSIAQITINQTVADEFLINAYTAAYYGVPVCFVSGDQGVCDSAKTLNPEIKTAAVNQGVGNSVISLHPQTACKLIQQTVEEALNEDLSKYQIELPSEFDVRITYKKHADAYRKAFYPGAELITPQTIQFKTGDYFEVLRLFLFTT